MGGFINNFLMTLGLKIYLFLSSVLRGGEIFMILPLDNYSLNYKIKAKKKIIFFSIVFLQTDVSKLQLKKYQEFRIYLKLVKLLCKGIKHK